MPTVPATLPRHRVERVEGGDWPVLLPGGDGVAGALTEPLDAGTLARIDWYEGGYDCARSVVSVDAAGMALEAGAYRSEAGGDGAWSLGAWRGHHGDRTLIAAAEIMRAMGRETAAALTRRRATIHSRAAAMCDTARHRRAGSVGGGLTRTDIGEVRETALHDGFNSIRALDYAFPRFDGTRSPPITREVIVAGHAATLLPYDPVRDRVLLVEQLRAGALALHDPQPWLLEPVAGLIDAGEDAATAALREAREEAGLVVEADALRFVARYYPTPGAVGQVLHSYVALCDLPDGAARLGGVASEAEDIRGHLVGFDALMGMLDSGEAANATLIVSARWLAANRARLRGEG